MNIYKDSLRFRKIDIWQEVNKIGSEKAQEMYELGDLPAAWRQTAHRATLDRSRKLVSLDD